MSTSRIYRDRESAERSAAPALRVARLDPASVDRATIHISGEAESRYRERFRADLSYSAAHDDLQARVIADGVVTTEAPPWVFRSSHAVGYVVIADDVCLPLRWHRSHPWGTRRGDMSLHGG